jgi:hypothetical protein
MKNYVNNSNFIELVCELAMQITVAELGEKTAIKDSGNNETEYTKAGQDFFNEKYDEVEQLLNEIINVWSDNEEHTFKRN